ncbi:hypothetical protein EVAR_17720_1 [Eumeta japonica]|uniref:Uncharacterized protein n=1 Tax=Eumeta variegata TaxID=151549 RepID=A0A4C1UT64_EUMVA|nr:hypothetical protein EVAR_17720_1 [Eumeta japonica]
MAYNAVHYHDSARHSQGIVTKLGTLILQKVIIMDKYENEQNRLKIILQETIESRTCPLRKQRQSALAIEYLTSDVDRPITMQLQCSNEIVAASCQARAPRDVAPARSVRT